MLARIAFAAIAAAIAFSTVTEARDVQVQGYVTKNGTYVAPHMRSAPDSSVNNNYSTRGNVNPYTGQEGTRTPEPSYGYTNPYAGSYAAPSPPPAAQPYYNPPPSYTPPYNP